MSEVSTILVFTTKITQPCPQVFSVKGALTCRGLHFWRHFLVKHKILPNFVISNWLWWIMRVPLANQNRGNILNEYLNNGCLFLCFFNNNNGNIPLIGFCLGFESSINYYWWYYFAFMCCVQSRASVLLGKYDKLSYNGCIRFNLFVYDL